MKSFLYPFPSHIQHACKRSGTKTFCYSNHIVFSLWSFTCAHHMAVGIAITSRFTYEKVISFLMTLNQTVLDTNPHTRLAWRRKLYFCEEKTFCIDEQNLWRTYFRFLLFSSRLRFLYWRVCCYVCTREPKKNKKRQMMRRETYRQQQQLALQDRPV